MDWAYIIDRLPAVGLGAVIGYGLSYLQDRVMARFRRGRHGEVRGTRLTSQNLGMFLVVILTVYSSIAAQRSLDQSEATQFENTGAINCIVDTQLQLAEALRERTNFGATRDDSNVALVQAQADFFAILVRAPNDDTTPEEFREALRVYFAALTTFLTDAAEYQQASFENPYPKPGELRDCLREVGVELPDPEE